jgi:hypothetical protein
MNLFFKESSFHLICKGRMKKGNGIKKGGREKMRNAEENKERIKNL